MKSNYLIYITLVLVLLSTGCKKFLDAKPDQKLAIPSTLEDLQSLLDHTITYIEDPNPGQMSSDDFYLSSADWKSLASEYDKNMYIWNKSDLFSPNVNPWSTCYNSIYYCNAVLETLEKIERTSKNAVAWDDIKGQALYFRGRRLLHASYIWMMPYDKNTSASDLGLPLRLTTNFNELSVRATAAETYDQLLKDIRIAIPLLPAKSFAKTRASRAAAYALLSRAYLSMRDYQPAFNYADSALQISSELLDFNDLDSSLPMPLVRFNTEVIVENLMSEDQAMNLTRAKVNPELYRLYDDHDLRKQVFFQKNKDASYSFKGRFGQGATLFSGMSTNELYLTRAECSVRLGKTSDALNDLNALLIKRYHKDNFNRVQITDQRQLLNVILLERRKELLFRGIRWIDIRRLNKEEADIILTREIDGKVYILLPNEPRYALPIPEDVIALTNMPQNER